jgi:hypothetical protein
VSKPLDQKELAAKITAAMGGRPLLIAEAA